MRCGPSLQLHRRIPNSAQTLGTAIWVFACRPRTAASWLVGLRRGGERGSELTIVAAAMLVMNASSNSSTVSR